MLREPEVCRIGDPPLGLEPNGLQRVALKRARLDLHESDRPSAFHDQVDLAERRLVAAGKRAEALGNKQKQRCRFGDVAVTIGGTPLLREVARGGAGARAQVSCRS